MRHAYLILAHNEFELLSLLINTLDRTQNEIFVHFDKKVKTPPLLSSKHAGLHILDNRVDVRWADVSMIEAEYALFEEAYKIGGFGYYHLLSGVDLPIKTQDFIDHFFIQNRGKEFIGYYQGPFVGELKNRAGKVHLFPKHFRERYGLINLSRRTLRRGFLILQSIIGFERNKNIEFKKGTQWVSITEDFVAYILDHKKESLKIYRNSFVSDELFLQTLCWNSPFKERIYNISNEGHGSMRFIGWENGELKDFTIEDYDRIMSSEALFARKFNSKHIDVVHKIINHIEV